MISTCSRRNALPAMPFIALTLCLASFPVRAEAPQFLSLRQLKIAIEKAIYDAKSVSDQPPYFIVESIDLNLTGETRTDGGGGFSIPIFSSAFDLSAKGGYAASETLELTLVPPEQSIVGGENPVDFTSLIRDLKESFADDTKDKQSLHAQKITYAKTWALKRTAEGSINVFVAKGNASIASDKSERITFHLCQTENQVDCVGH